MTHGGIGSRVSCLRTAKSTSRILVSAVSNVFRYAAMSTPRRKIVASDVDGCTAKRDSDEARDASTTVRTLGKESLVSDNGDTGRS